MKKKPKQIATERRGVETNFRETLELTKAFQGRRAQRSQNKRGFSSTLCVDRSSSSSIVLSQMAKPPTPLRHRKKTRTSKTKDSGINVSDSIADDLETLSSLEGDVSRRERDTNQHSTPNIRHDQSKQPQTTHFFSQRFTRTPNKCSSPPKRSEGLYTHVISEQGEVQEKILKPDVPFDQRRNVINYQCDNMILENGIPSFIQSVSECDVSSKHPCSPIREEFNQSPIDPNRTQRFCHPKHSLSETMGKVRMSNMNIAKIVDNLRPGKQSHLKCQPNKQSTSSPSYPGQRLFRCNDSRRSSGYSTIHSTTNEPEDVNMCSSCNNVYCCCPKLPYDDQVCSHEMLKRTAMDGCKERHREHTEKKSKLTDVLERYKKMKKDTEILKCKEEEIIHDFLKQYLENHSKRKADNKPRIQVKDCFARKNLKSANRFVPATDQSSPEEVLGPEPLDEMTQSFVNYLNERSSAPYFGDAFDIKGDHTTQTEKSDVFEGNSESECTESVYGQEWERGIDPKCMRFCEYDRDRNCNVSGIYKNKPSFSYTPRPRKSCEHNFRPTPSPYKQRLENVGFFPDNDNARILCQDRDIQVLQDPCKCCGCTEKANKSTPCGGNISICSVLESIIWWIFCAVILSVLYTVLVMYANRNWAAVYTIIWILMFLGCTILLDPIKFFICGRSPLTLHTPCEIS